MLLNLCKAASQDTITVHITRTQGNITACQETDPTGQISSLSPLKFETIIDPCMTEIVEPDAFPGENSISEELRTSE